MKRTTAIAQNIRDMMYIDDVVDEDVRYPAFNGSIQGHVEVILKKLCDIVLKLQEAYNA